MNIELVGSNVCYIFPSIYEKTNENNKYSLRMLEAREYVMLHMKEHSEYNNLIKYINQSMGEL